MQLARVAATAWALAALRLVLDPAALARVAERRARPEAAGLAAAHPPLEAPARARVAAGRRLRPADRSVAAADLLARKDRVEVWRVKSRCPKRSRILALSQQMGTPSQNVAGATLGLGQGNALSGAGIGSSMGVAGPHGTPAS